MTSRADQARRFERAVAVTGLWHLGCTLTAAWLRLGRRVIAVDPTGEVIAGMRAGTVPVEEPGVRGSIAEGLTTGQLTLTKDASGVRECEAVFVAHDTTVREDDSVDLSEVTSTIEIIGQHARAGLLVLVSSQIPVGTARHLDDRIRKLNGGVQLLYVPENLRLGRALEDYLRPDYLVFGSARGQTPDSVIELFSPIQAKRFHVTFETAEMVKHAVNSFLATTVTLANEWADISSVVNADYMAVEQIVRADERVGERAYVTPGVGFSGGTLGRDVGVLAETARSHLGEPTSLFARILERNRDRSSRLTRQLADHLGPGRKVAILGMTYKPGTSTLRRSRPLEIARVLSSSGLIVSAHDPGANWAEADLDGIDVRGDPYGAASSADVLLLLTAWPQYRALDLLRLASALRRKRVIDPGGVLRERADELQRAGFLVSWAMTVPESWKS